MTNPFNTLHRIHSHQTARQLAHAFAAVRLNTNDSDDHQLYAACRAIGAVTGTGDLLYRALSGFYFYPWHDAEHVIEPAAIAELHALAHAYLDETNAT